MASTPQFISMIIALLSDTFWITKENSSVYLANHSLPRYLCAAIIVGKQLLHFAYDLNSGQLMKKSINEGLSFAKNIGTRRYIGFQDFQKLRQFELNEFTHYDVFDVLKSRIAMNAWCSVLEIDDFNKSLTIVHSVPESLEDESGAAGTILRSIMCVTGAIQRLNIEFLKFAKKKPQEYLGFSRTVYKVKMSKIPSKSQIREAWQSYFFDIASMWMIARHFHCEITNKTGSSGYNHALSRSKLWLSTSGLTNSAKLLKIVEPQCSVLLEQIADTSRVLYWLYDRLQAYTNVQPVQIMKHVFSTDDVEPYKYTSHLGFSCDQGSLIGLDLKDRRFSQFVGIISQKFTQSIEHMWTCTTNPKVWESKMDQGLIKMCDFHMQITKFSSECSWLPSFDDIDENMNTIRLIKKREESLKEQRQIEALVKALD